MNKTHKLKFNHQCHKLVSADETSATKTTLLQPVADKTIVNQPGVNQPPANPGFSAVPNVMPVNQQPAASEPTTEAQSTSVQANAIHTADTISAENTAASADDLALQQFSALSHMLNKHHSIHIVLRSWYDYFTSATEQEKLAQLSHTASLIPGETLPGKIQ